MWYSGVITSIANSGFYRYVLSLPLGQRAVVGKNTTPYPNNGILKHNLSIAIPPLPSSTVPAYTGQPLQKGRHRTPPCPWGPYQVLGDAEPGWNSITTWHPECHYHMTTWRDGYHHATNDTCGQILLSYAILDILSDLSLVSLFHELCSSKKPNLSYTVYVNYLRTINLYTEWQFKPIARSIL